MNLKDIYSFYLYGLVRVCELENPNEKTPMTNAHAELYFHLKKSNDEANNIPLVKYSEKK